MLNVNLIQWVLYCNFSLTLISIELTNKEVRKLFKNKNSLNCTIIDSSKLEKSKL